MQQPPWPQQSYYSSHYAQAYMQHALPAPPTRPQGYVPSSYNPVLHHATPVPSTWHQPGASRCTYKDCTFRGSPQTLETHMMDRHLVFPPGWDKRKTKPDWDADPSLKGKSIPIQGTTVVLDSPEELDAWIAERKRRWPSAPRVEEKKRKMEEAVARGQLSLEDSGLGGARKRRRVDEGNGEQGRGRGRGNARARGRGRGVEGGRGRGSDVGRGRGVDGGWRGRGRGAAPQQSRPAPPSEDSSSSSDSDDDETPPEVVSSRSEAIAPPGPPTPPPAEIATRRPRAPLQPKPPIRNPFASRPTLLRNLLLPEIRITVSNLSQAIRFLVDNDFLQNVELKPGEGNKKLIEVLGEDNALELSS
ncbi:nuclear fragile X mental retardation-interacting protein 1-domain-containing protein [Mycena filopes]|nr:nuclear fragile X mental retardation-interacting protein 1-domain-containing protein [Mycena filopes]